MNFKTGNPALIKIAMNGDQKGSKADSWSKESKDLGAPTDLSLITAVKESLPMSANKVGESDKGGFWDMPFADDKGAWVIEGSAAQPQFGCGDTL